jgi:MFS family permease
MRRIAWSSFLGSAIEFYDFLLYGAAAAIVFDKLFFSNLDPLTGTIAAFGTLAVGYVSRPLGGVVFGHFGDRVGRKAVLVTTMSLMGLASVMIGLLPTYGQVGTLAPVLLVTARLIQGFALGGEWGGAALMPLEHAAPQRRGLAAACAGMGGPAGAVLATGVFTAASTLPSNEFLSWGWRIPFLLSTVLLGIGLFIRTRINESPVFTQARVADAAQGRTESPLRTVLRRHPKHVLLACFSILGALVWQSIPATFLITYALGQGKAPTTVLLIQTATSAVAIGAIAFYATLSDRWGRRPVMTAGALAMAAAAYPVLHFASGSTVQVAVAFFLVNSVIQPAMYGPAPAFVSEMFATRARYTGASLGYQLAATFGAGLAPLAASSLLATAGGGRHIGLVALFGAGACLVSAAAIRLTRETKDTPLNVPAATAAGSPAPTLLP